MFLRLDDRTIHVRTQGPSGAPAIMLLHALGGSIEIWDEQADALAQGLRVVRFDLPGHGLSAPMAGPVTVEQLAEVTFGLLDALGIDTAHVAGVSIGGMIAQAMATAAPARLGSLILCNTVPVFPPDVRDGWRDRAARVRAEGMQPLVEDVVARWLTADALSTAAGDGLRAMLRRTDAWSYAFGGEAIAACDLTTSTAAVRVPTLVLAGDSDTATPASAVEAMARTIRHSRYKLLERAAHIPMVEQPEAVLSAMRGFLAEAPPGPFEHAP